MLQLKRILLPILMLASSAAVQAQSITMGFEDISTLGETGADYGVLFEHSDGYQFLVDAGASIPSYSGHALAYYGLMNQGETLTLSAGSAATFALHSLDLAGLVGFLPGETLSIQISGVRADGSTVTASQPFALLGGQFASYGGSVFAGFNGLTSLHLSGVGGAYARYVGVDNIAITITPVPEPESLAMLLAGLGVLGWQLRRRRAR